MSTVGQTGTQTACAVDLSGADESQSREVAKSLRGKTRKSNK